MSGNQALIEFDSQEVVNNFLQGIHDQIAQRTEAVKSYSEALSSLRCGRANSVFIGDYDDSDKYIVCVPGAYLDDTTVLEHNHGRNNLKYNMPNSKALSGLNLFETAVSRHMLLAAAGQVVALSEAQIETIQRRIRGNITTGEARREEI